MGKSGVRNFEPPARKGPSKSSVYNRGGRWCRGLRELQPADCLVVHPKQATDLG
jgi:hypothetical protein